MARRSPPVSGRGPAQHLKRREQWISGRGRLAWENKIAKGFNTTDIPLEFCLLQGEIAEAFDAWRKGREDMGEELADADIAIYLFGLAQMTGVDLHRNHMPRNIR
jgi:hypothetical protein